MPAYEEETAKTTDVDIFQSLAGAHAVLESRLGNLAEEIGLLETTLSPVLTPTNPSPSLSEIRETMEYSEIHLRVRAEIDHVDTLRRRIQDLVSRLNLS
jgi:hypothetical protein